VGYTYLQPKIAAITLKVDQGHWRRHNSISLIIRGLYLSRIISEIFNVEACPWNL